MDVAADGTTQIRDEAIELTAENQTAIFARETAKKILTTHCGAGYNTVVLPAAEWKQEGWLVYFLVPQTDVKKIPTGGHVRVHVSADGRSVLSKHELSPGCMALSVPGPGGALGVMTPHADVILEHFVFLSLAYHVDLFVTSTSGSSMELRGSQAH